MPGLETDSDEDFDRIYPKEVRKLSGRLWTPIAVARRAVGLLLPKGTGRVLDFGSGAGKFCIVGARTSAGRFTGYETDPALVKLSRELCKEHGIERARFVAGDALGADWDEFDGVYLYNPFEKLAEADRVRLVAATQARLDAARAGLRVVLFHGLGGPMPPSWTRLAVEPAGHGELELWEHRD